jgi:pimeloyl-ACP methyl ester carboxylesterase
VRGTLESLPLRRTVISGEIEIHYAEEGTGPALVFVHGGMGDWSSWAPQWEAFTPHFRCITYSRRYSSPNRNPITSRSHSVVAEAQDLAALLDTWHADRAILVGTSYGAFTSLQLALTHPGKVRALALTEPPVLPFADQTQGGREARLRFEREVLSAAAEAFAAGEHAAAVHLLTEGINGTGPGEASTLAGRERRLRNADAMRALLISSDAFPKLDEAALRQLDAPTLLLHGARTLEVHRATTTALSRSMPRAELIEVPHSGHGVHRDNPAAFNNIVMDFLTRHMAPPTWPQSVPAKDETPRSAVSR